MVGGVWSCGARCLRSPVKGGGGGKGEGGGGGGPFPASTCHLHQKSKDYTQTCWKKSLV